MLALSITPLTQDRGQDNMVAHCNTLFRVTRTDHMTGTEEQVCGIDD
jgi:hypothetical protein